MHPLAYALDDQATVIKHNVRLIIAWALAVLAAGVVVTIFLYFWPPATQYLGDFAMLGPSIISAAFSTFFLKTITGGRERFRALKNLTVLVQAAEALPPTEREKIFDLASDALREFTKRV